MSKDIYIVIRNKNINELIDEVNSKIYGGYECLGGISSVMDTYIQAMIRIDR